MYILYVYVCMYFCTCARMHFACIYVCISVYMLPAKSDFKTIQFSLGETSLSVGKLVLQCPAKRVFTRRNYCQTLLKSGLAGKICIMYGGKYASLSCIYSQFKLKFCNTNVQTYVCAFVCMYICMYIHLHTYSYVHTRI